MTTHLAAEVTPVSPRTGRRLRALGALAVDLALLVGGVLLGASLTAAWLLTRTGYGLLDVAPEDGTAAMAVSTAALPAWAAAELWALARGHRTIGSALLRLPPGTPPTDAVLRVGWLTLHPATGPLWLWAAAAVGLLTPITAMLALAAVGLLVLLLGAASLAALLIRPGGELIHTRLLRSFLDDGGR